MALSIFDKYERKGREEGRREQAQTMLSKALEHRFGHLPAAARKRIASADNAELQRWFDRALDAESLDEVFASRGGVLRARVR